MRANFSSFPWLGLCAFFAACGGGSSATDARGEDGSLAGGATAAGGRDGGTVTGGVATTGGAAAGGLATTGTRLDAAAGGTGSGGALGSGGLGDAGDAPEMGGAVLDAGLRDAGSRLLDAPGVDRPVSDAADARHPPPADAPAIDAALSDRPVGRASTCLGPTSAALANASLPAGYCAWTWASDLSSPRGIVRNELGDILVVEQKAGRITLLYDDDGNGVSDTSERVVLTTGNGLNHGIALSGGYLYASSASTVYRWAYTGGRQALGAPQTVVTGIPTDGHRTRTLLFDQAGSLYVSVGSQYNVDPDADRARIVRYPAAGLGSSSTFAQGEGFAIGLRNEVGITLDGQGRLWGVENGSDELSRTDLGGDIHNDNPGEELHLFAQPGAFYGYPYCWTEYALPTGVGMGRGTQWAYPATMDDGTHSDAWCRNVSNVVRPALVMQAHSAPLDIKFYAGAAFPSDMLGSAIVTFHGSWNRSPATGYKVVRIPFGQDGMPSGDPTPLLEYSGAGDNGSGWPHRPVGIETGVDGRLFVTSDASGIVIAIGHNGG